MGLIGCGVNGAWAARCLAAAGYGPGVLLRPSHRGGRGAGRGAGLARAGGRGGGGEPGDRCHVHAGGRAGRLRLRPASRPAHRRPRRRSRQGKAEVELAALERCSLFCDEWIQASKGGELSGAVAAGLVGRERVTEIGEVLLGRRAGRTSADEVTLFDSTGLATQDLGIALAVLDAVDAGRIRASTACL